MPISHFFAEGIGPFKKLHLDFTGPDGHPSMGPHILAGVNGSGKSTILKAIAWAGAVEGDEFPVGEWIHFLKGHSTSRVLLVIDVPGVYSYFAATSEDGSAGWEDRLTAWTEEQLCSIGTSRKAFPPIEGGGGGRLISGGSVGTDQRRFVSAAYSTGRFLQFIEQPSAEVSADDATMSRFSFNATVRNEVVQSWLTGLYSKRAIAQTSAQSTERYTSALKGLELGLQNLCGERVSIVMDIEPHIRPKLRIGPQTLNLSQIPDGLKSTLGWLTDFMMRRDKLRWDPALYDKRPGLLLFDEIEGYLHPKWQRRVLPALREALPEVQAIVTSHSPFVISSSPEAMIHVLKVNSDGTAYNEPPIKAPIGESITSTLKDIFGIESRFDVETEKELNEWNELSRERSGGKLKPSEERRFNELTRVLSSRSEELRSIVQPIPKLSKATVDHLTAPSNGRRSRGRKVASR